MVGALLLAVCSESEAAAEDRRPLVAYWVSRHDLPPPAKGPWRAPSENPRWVLYDDGLLLFAGAQELPQAETLSEAARKRVLDTVDEDFLGLPDSVSGTQQMHPTVHLITRWKNGTRKTVRFFGDAWERADAGSLPAPLRRALTVIAALKPSEPKPWSPSTVVVRACRTSAAPTKQGWPAHWPRIDSGRTVSYLKDCFEHALAGSEQPKAEALVGADREFTVVKAAEASWLVSAVRFAFPAEESWAGR